MRLVVAVLVVVMLAGCGDAEPTWQDRYRSELRADNDARDPVEVVQACSLIDSLSDDQLRQVWAEEAGSVNNVFNQVMAELELEPAVDDYNEAIRIATDEARRLCNR